MKELKFANKLFENGYTGAVKELESILSNKYYNGVNVHLILDDMRGQILLCDKALNILKVFNDFENTPKADYRLSIMYNKFMAKIFGEKYMMASAQYIGLNITQNAAIVADELHKNSDISTIKINNALNNLEYYKNFARELKPEYNKIDNVAKDYVNSFELNFKQ